MRARKGEWKRRVLAGFGFLLAAFWTAIAAPPQSSQAPAQVTSTAKNRASLAITLYNSNFALVRETRQVDLPAGAVQLAFEDVPSSIEPSTVHLSATAGVDVIDQSYEYDLLNPERLLDKYLGKEMTLIFRGPEDGATRETDVRAILLSTSGPVWKIGNEIVTGIRPNGYRFPELPGGLYSSPTLLWNLRAARAGQRTLDVTYLADQMTWQANYVLDLTPGGHHGSLDGWVTLSNNSGASFENASLSLVAGQVHRAAPPRPQPMPVMYGLQAAKAAAAPQQFSQEAAGEYHLYRLNRRVDLGNNESKQISLFSASDIPIDETYVVEGNSSIFQTRLPEGEPAPEPVEVYLSFRNAKGAGLGQPLPAGTVQAYQPDSQGNPILLGEDRINHTPIDETARLDIGNAFDLTAERRQTDFRVVSANVRESAFEITLHNHKPEAVTIQVREPVGGSWTVLESNFPAKKLGAFTLEFDVPVPAHGTATLNYRIRVTYQ